MKIKFLCTLMVVLMLEACSNDEPETKSTDPTFVMTDGYGLMTDDADCLEVIEGLTRILKLSVSNNQLYVLGMGTNSNLVMWHDGQVQDIDITPADGTWLGLDFPQVDQGKAYYMYWKGSFDNRTYFVKGFPDGKEIELEPLAGPFPGTITYFPISFRVHGDQVYALASYNVRYEFPQTTYGSAYVWIDGKVVQLSSEPNVTISSIDGNDGHYVAVGTRGTNEQGRGITAYWHDGKQQVLDKRDSDRARAIAYMHGNTPILYGCLFYVDEQFNVDEKACLWIDGQYVDLSQGRDSDVVGVLSSGDDYYAFVHDNGSINYHIWKNAKYLKTFSISSIVDCVVY